MPPKISIIVPVYKAEKYLRACLHSLVTQTFTDIEVLAVDNDSPDRCADIIREFNAKHPFIHYLYRKGGGAGGARNEGIQQAKGEYIAFLDADDLLDPNALENLYQTAKDTQADIVSCAWYNVAPQGEKISSFPKNNVYFELNTQTDSSLKILQAGGKIGMPWGKLIKRSILADNGLLFPENLPSEDVALICTCFLLTGKYVHIPAHLWYYRYVPSSQSNTTRQLAPRSLFITFSQMRDFLKQKGLYQGEIAEEWEYILLKMLIGGEAQGNGGLKNLSRSNMEEFFRLSRDFYLSLPNTLFRQRNFIFRSKFKIFKTALKHNWYSLPKSARPFLNLISLFSGKK